MKSRYKFILGISIALLLIACSNKWNQPDLNAPQAFIDQENKRIEENLNLLKDDPDNTKALLQVAFGYHELQNYGRTIEYYEKLLELQENHPVALNNLADIYETVEEYDKAAKYIKLLYKDNQTDREVIQDAVRILLKADNPVNAKEALENFVKLTKATATESDQIMISNLFQSIVNYKSSQ